jgi:hypothetical protein
LRLIGSPVAEPSLEPVAAGALELVNDHDDTPPIPTKRPLRLVSLY